MLMRKSLKTDTVSIQIMILCLTVSLNIGQETHTAHFPLILPNLSRGFAYRINRGEKIKHFSSSLNAHFSQFIFKENLSLFMLGYSEFSFNDLNICVILISYKSAKKNNTIRLVHSTLIQNMINSTMQVDKLQESQDPRKHFVHFLILETHTETQMSFITISSSGPQCSIAFYYIPILKYDIYILGQSI